MHRARWVTRTVFLVAVAAAVTIVVIEIRDRKRRADEAVDDIESKLDELDPVTRAAVVARVGVDTARRR
jgi:hypothetical protein